MKDKDEIDEVGEYSAEEKAFMDANQMPEETFHSLHRLCYDAVESYGPNAVNAMIAFVSDEMSGE